MTRYEAIKAASEAAEQSPLPLAVVEFTDGSCTFDFIESPYLDYLVHEQEGEIIEVIAPPGMDIDITDFK